jgi:ornithine cyclodeaminase/alanine dehydrogenase
MLFLTDDDVRRLVTMKEAMATVEKAFGEYAKGHVLMPPRSTMMLEKHRGSISLMPSYLEETGVAATKIISIYPQNPAKGLPTSIAQIIVNDPETGRFIATIEASYLTALRTGAVTGVAAQYLARKDSRIAAIIGCGIQGQTQAWAVAESRPIETFRCYDLSRGRSQAFAEEMSRRLKVEVLSAETAKEAVRDADIVVTSTTSKEPVIQRDWLWEGVHISAIGSFYPDHRELDTATVRDAKVVVDSRAASLAEAGDLIIPLKEGAITEEHIYAELGELVIGLKPSRTKEEELSLFKSVGLAIQDSSVAGLVIKKWMESLINT